MFAADAPREVTMNLAGAASVVTLSGEKNDVNTIEREKVVPVAGKLAFDGKIAVPAHSLTVLRVER